jgi:hypothetical protein
MQWARFQAALAVILKEHDDFHSVSKRQTGEESKAGLKR